jgi:hypothetical protein
MTLNHFKTKPVDISEIQNAPYRKHIKNKCWILNGEAIAFCFTKHIKYVNALCGQKVNI